MEVRTKATGFELPQATATYLDERLAHIEKLLGESAALARCEVEVGRDAGRPRHGEHIWMAEFTLERPGYGTLRATNRSESLNGAIDDAKAEIENQIRSGKRVAQRDEREGGAEAKRLMREE